MEGHSCLDLKRCRSTGTDRARDTCILAGLGMYIPLAILLPLTIPGLMEGDVTAQDAPLLTVVPPGVTACALLRHRLLDVRLAVRYTFTYLVALPVFGLPLLAFYLVFGYPWRQDPRVYVALSARILALAVALTPAVLRWLGVHIGRLATDLPGIRVEMDSRPGEGSTSASISGGHVPGGGQAGLRQRMSRRPQLRFCILHRLNGGIINPAANGSAASILLRLA